MVVQVTRNRKTQIEISKNKIINDDKNEKHDMGKVKNGCFKLKKIKEKLTGSRALGLGP
jgi:hypothetical protein